LTEHIYVTLDKGDIRVTRTYTALSVLLPDTIQDMIRLSTYDNTDSDKLHVCMTNRNRTRHYG